MCIIQPFKVERWPFLRDVGFFTTAVAMLLVILWDGRIRPVEAGSMVVLYGFYVLVVAVGSWRERRRLRREQYEEQIRGEYRDDGRMGFGPFRDDGELTKSTFLFKIAIVMSLLFSNGFANPSVVVLFYR